jgi:hypothetical protein
LKITPIIFTGDVTAETVTNLDEIQKQSDFSLYAQDCVNMDSAYSTLIRLVKVCQKGIFRDPKEGETIDIRCFSET